MLTPAVRIVDMHYGRSAACFCVRRMLLSDSVVVVD